MYRAVTPFRLILLSLVFVAGTGSAAVAVHPPSPDGGRPALRPGIRPLESRTAATAPVIAAAGDIACGHAGVQADECRHRWTSDRVLEIDPDAVLLLGDLQYESGQIFKFRRFYDPTWGRFKDISRPSPGNREYNTAEARGYFRYFEEPPPYYSFDLGAWHLISLNSEIPYEEGTPQNDWLEQDLAATTARCVLAYWHEPRFSSTNYVEDDPKPLWVDLFRARADVILNGHMHNYERFAKMRTGGRIDLDRGIRQFVVGTGGKSLHGFNTELAGSQARYTYFGVLRMTLAPKSYRWAFVTEYGRVLDEGWSRCDARGGVR